MTKIRALSKEINERIARQCILVLLDDDESSISHHRKDQTWRQIEPNSVLRELCAIARHV